MFISRATPISAKGSTNYKSPSVTFSEALDISKFEIAK